MAGILCRPKPPPPPIPPDPPDLSSFPPLPPSLASSPSSASPPRSRQKTLTAPTELISTRNKTQNRPSTAQLTPDASLKQKGKHCEEKETPNHLITNPKLESQSQLKTPPANLTQPPPGLNLTHPPLLPLPPTNSLQEPILTPKPTCTQIPKQPPLPTQKPATVPPPQTATTSYPSQTATPTGPTSKQDQTPTDTTNSWASKVKQRTDKSLKRLAPTTTSPTGLPRVKIPDSVFHRGAELHRDYIIGYFLGKTPPFNQIQSILGHMWGKGSRLEIHVNQINRSMLVRIPNNYIRSKVLEKEYWHIGTSLFFVTTWTNQTAAIPTLKSIPLWAHVTGIHFDLMHQEGLSYIAGLLGTPVEMDDWTLKLTSIREAHLKIRADLTSPLPTQVEAEREDGSILSLEVTYPWVPSICSHCKELGHTLRFCPSATPIWVPKAKNPPPPTTNHPPKPPTTNTNPPPPTKDPTQTTPPIKNPPAQHIPLNATPPQTNPPALNPITQMDLTPIPPKTKPRFKRDRLTFITGLNLNLNHPPLSLPQTKTLPILSPLSLPQNPHNLKKPPDISNSKTTLSITLPHDQTEECSTSTAGPGSLLAKGVISAPAQ